MQHNSRRAFLATVSTAALTAATSRKLVAQKAGQPSVKPTAAEPTHDFPIAIFEKPFEGLSFDRLADCIEEIGADGVEATIREGGHIEPQSAKDEIPKMAEALAQRGKKILIAATSVNEASKENESYLRLLADGGVTHYRLAHFRYDLKKPIAAQINSIRAKLTDLAQLNAEVGIQGVYQTHSGSSKKQGYFGSLALDLATALDGIDPSALGVAFDTRHMRKDTGSSYHLAIAALKPHIKSVYVKDGIWQGDRTRKYKNVALDTGFVDFELFSELMSAVRMNTERPMPLSIHMEWLGYRVFPDNEIPDAVAACKRDTDTLVSWLKKIKNES